MSSNAGRATPGPPAGPTPPGPHDPTERPLVAADPISHLAVNRARWDERASAHAASTHYAFDSFARDPEFLSGVVRFDLPRLGDIAGLRGVHLQCHIGTDTVSLSRLGARMTGLDFSSVALAEARRLAGRIGAEVEFVEGDLYEAPELLGREGFDLVYTGIGALCWLPDVGRWAGVVSDLLRPGGRLFIREGHPMLWTLDVEPTNGLLVVEDVYFEQAEPLIMVETGTYVETDVTFAENRSCSWNHGLGEIVGGLLDAGMELTMLVEHDSVPWDAIPGQMVRDEHGEWRLADRPRRLPQSYTLQAVKRA